MLVSIDMMFSCLFNVVLICVGKVTKNIPIIAHFGPKNRPTALVGAVSPLVLEGVISFSECYWAVPHAACGSEGGQGSGEDADDDLQDGLPSFFLHGVNRLKGLSCNPSLNREGQGRGF